MTKNVTTGCDFRDQNTHKCVHLQPHSVSLTVLIMQGRKADQENGIDRHPSPPFVKVYLWS